VSDKLHSKFHLIINRLFAAIFIISIAHYIHYTRNLGRFAIHLVWSCHLFTYLFRRQCTAVYRQIKKNVIAV